MAKKRRKTGIVIRGADPKRRRYHREYYRRFRSKKREKRR